MKPLNWQTMHSDELACFFPCTHA
uniref:Uncharacterized protein n=1 Tax=Anguilla anguilla TaxID=7936 RepID=A0A0E9RAH2_ANGAN